jgi:hypothetical protein
MVPVAMTQVTMGLRTCTDRAVIICGHAVTQTSGISPYIDLTQDMVQEQVLQWQWVLDEGMVG